MKLTTKLFLGLIAILAGAALYMYLFRTKKVATPDTNTAAQLTALNLDKVSRAELANIIQKTQLPGATTSPIGVDQITGNSPETFIDSIKTKLTN
jgi:hypothetical protein